MNTDSMCSNCYSNNEIVLQRLKWNYFMATVIGVYAKSYLFCVSSNTLQIVTFYHDEYSEFTRTMYFKSIKSNFVKHGWEPLTKV